MIKRKLVQFNQWDCYIPFGKYKNGRTAITLFDVKDDQPVAKATINIPDIELKDNEILIKDYSENEGMTQALSDAGIIKFRHSIILNYVIVDLVELLINPKDY